VPAAAEASISGSVNAGTHVLTVSSNAGDEMHIFCSGNKVFVNATQLGGGDCTDVQSAVVSGGPDANIIDLAGVTTAGFPNLPVGPSTPAVVINGNGGDDNPITGSAVRDAINGGLGMNTMNGGPGDDAFTSVNDGAINSFNGNSGTDTITFGGTSNGIITATPTSLNNLDGAQTVAEIESVTINAPGQENTFDMTAAPFPCTVNGNFSNDVFYSSQFNDTFHGAGQGIADIVGAKTDSANVTLTATSLSGTAIGADTIDGVERGQIISPSVLGTSAAVMDSTFDASAFPGPVDLEGGTGNDTLTGGGSGDTLGAPSPNPIPGGAEETGGDLLIGGGGNDTLRGGPDEDFVQELGVPGPVTVGASSMNARGNDTLNGVETVLLTGDSGNNTITASAFGGTVILDGGAGDDTLTGTAQGDSIRGGPGSDTMNGGGGNNDLLSEATGSATSAALTDTTLTGFGGAPSESIASFESAVLNGSPGNDTFDASGYAGFAQLRGNDGDDTLMGGPGDGLFNGGAGTDTVRDTNVAGATVGATSMDAHGTDTLGAIEVVSLTGTSGNNTIDASAFGGRAELDGAGGDDTLTGTAHDDTITGAAGNDALTAGDGTDRLIETAADPTAATLTNTALSGFGGAPNETISGFEAATLNGSAGSDTFDATGFGGPVTLNGSDGNDTLTGGPAADAFSGGAGSDSLNAKDNAADTAIDCGADADSAEADAIDPAVVDCETLNGQPNPPPNADKKAPRITVRAGKVDRKGRVPLRFRCPADETSCTGTFKLTLTGKKKKVGSGRFKASGGKVALVRPKLSRAARAKLKKKHRLKVVLSVTASDAAGNRATRRVTLKLTPKRRKPS
jgi:Ca2+-binding RTX toxin-like protein